MNPSENRVVEPLAELVLDLRSTWWHACDALWAEIHAKAWERSASLSLLLQGVQSSIPPLFRGAGSPPILATEQLTLQRKRSDLEKRREALRRG